jgi:hypothetical protein
MVSWTPGAPRWAFAFLPPKERREMDMDHRDETEQRDERDGLSLADAEEAHRAHLEAEMELDRVLLLAGHVYGAVIAIGRGSVAVTESVRIAREILAEARKPVGSTASAIVPAAIRGHQQVPAHTVAPIQPTPVTHGAQAPQNTVPFPKQAIRPASNPSNFSPRQ